MYLLHVTIPSNVLDIAVGKHPMLESGDAFVQVIHRMEGTYQRHLHSDKTLVAPLENYCWRPHGNGSPS